MTSPPALPPTFRPVSGPSPRLGSRLGSRLGFRRNPLRQLGSASPWLATAYLAGYLPMGTLLFGGILSVLVCCTALNITWLGLPLLVGAAVVVRGAAQVERWRAGLVGEDIPAAYRPVTGTGVFAQLRGRWRDRAIRRDCAYLLLLFPPLLVLDLVALALWLAALAGLVLPLWFWAVPQRTPDGRTVHGVLLFVLVDSLPAALLAALCFALPVLAAGYLVVAAARLHARVAHALLGPWRDPLAEVHRMLAEPGPLTT